MNENKYLEKQNDMMGENSFMKKLLKKRLNQKGLTLIELLAVIVILAIVAAIAIPAIGNVIENSRFKAVKADAVNVLNAANLYYTENPNVTSDATVETLIDNDFLDTSGLIPDDATISKDSPRELSGTGNITYSGNLTISFNGATVAGINAATKASDGSTEITD